MFRLVILSFIGLLAFGKAGHAASPVDLALALLTDVSRSIDDSEFELEKKGFSAAFTSPEVIAAIQAGPAGAIAVTYIEFASQHEVKTVLDWTVIRDSASAADFVEKLNVAPRSYYGRTAISAGIDYAVQALAESGFEAPRRVIDVCGDGTNNAGREVTAARDDALQAGITINGLAIINEHPASWTFAHVQPPGGLPAYYRENVIGGPGSFVIEVRDFANFGEAMIRKLVTEIAAPSDRQSPASGSRVGAIQGACNEPGEPRIASARCSSQ